MSLMWIEPLVWSKKLRAERKPGVARPLLQVLGEREAAIGVYNLSARCHDLAHNAPACLFQQAPRFICYC
jgi:hypothetical protein